MTKAPKYDKPLKGWKRTSVHNPWWEKQLPGSDTKIYVDGNEDRTWEAETADNKLYKRGSTNEYRQFRTMRAAMIAVEKVVRQKLLRDLKALAPTGKK